MSCTQRSRPWVASQVWSRLRTSTSVLATIMTIGAGVLLLAFVLVGGTISIIVIVALPIVAGATVHLLSSFGPHAHFILMGTAALSVLLQARATYAVRRGLMPAIVEALPLTGRLRGLSPFISPAHQLPRHHSSRRNRAVAAAGRASELVGAPTQDCIPPVHIPIAPQRTCAPNDLGVNLAVPCEGYTYTCGVRCQVKGVSPGT